MRFASSSRQTRLPARSFERLESHAMMCVRAKLATLRVGSTGRRNGRKETRKARCHAASAPAIRVSDAALDHIKKMREESGGKELLLRVGVKEGGCSGMSYTMDFAEKENVKDDDSVLEFGDMKIICDPKSLLYIFGMELDYKSALIGGGFSFRNPNADKTCGCGKSFSV